MLAGLAHDLWALDLGALDFGALDLGALGFAALDMGIACAVLALSKCLLPY